MLPRPKRKQSAQARQMAAEIQAKEGRLRISRGTEHGIARRREQVKVYLTRGVPKVVMAELLGVSAKTIHEDVRVISKALGHKVSSIRSSGERVDQEIGLITSKIEAVGDAAMSEYAMARTGAIKDRFLNTAAKAYWVRARLLMETGVLPKAGEQIHITNKTEVTFSERFGKENPLAALDDPVARRKVLTAIENVLRTTAQPPMLTVESKPNP